MGTDSFFFKWQWFSALKLDLGKPLGKICVGIREHFWTLFLNSSSVWEVMITAALLLMADWIQRMKTISCIKLVLSKHMHTMEKNHLKFKLLLTLL